MDDLAKKVADVLARSSAAGRKATHRPVEEGEEDGLEEDPALPRPLPRRRRHAKGPGAKKTGAKKAGVKKAGA